MPENTKYTTLITDGSGAEYEIWTTGKADENGQVDTDKITTRAIKYVRETFHLPPSVVLAGDTTALAETA